MFRDKAKDGTTRITGGGPLAAWPVGSIYMSTDNTNPSTIFGGTWSAWGSGRVPVGVDTGQTEFNAVEKTGGEKTHTLTITEMPGHTHGPGSGSYHVTYAGSGGNGMTWSAGASLATPSTTGSTGGGGAHNNLQPYVTCYMWKRTA
jgi:hypothetical protein